MTDTHSGRPRKAPPQQSKSADPDTKAATPRRPKKLRPAEAIREGREQLAELTGRTVDAVSSFSATDDGGWRLEVEVLELSRVPDTMSLLASYEVTLDSDAMLTDYRRVRRYERGRSDERG
ncbi:gas vesicle protein [Streptomyces sp. SID8379]|uniref:gas vesicle protein GvpO n=1 Tax=unclassified Streptomyces TaxID=2593676 RepID=UPI0003823936|nr:MULTISPECIES: gas vesicle protein [unclassified Streptomyces]MYW69361.1 gas vesicle protein [Streptomyces sp. SID8379]MYW69404.1 gas vesicle protein [Streptomyces sp. SID8379]